MQKDLERKDSPWAHTARVMMQSTCHAPASKRPKGMNREQHRTQERVKPLDQTVGSFYPNALFIFGTEPEYRMDIKRFASKRTKKMLESHLANVETYNL